MAKRKTVGHRELEADGFTVLRTFRNPRWFKVQKGDDIGYIARQGPRCWHYFWSNLEGTGSGETPSRAMFGGLGDVIGTDSEMRTYKRIVLNAPTLIRNTCHSVYRASSDVFNHG